MTFRLVRRRGLPFAAQADDDLVDTRRRNRIWGDLDDTKDW